MVILVTGAGGMVGSHMVEILYEQGFDVIGTYYKPTVNLSEINPSIKMIECDIRYPENIERILFKYRPQLFHGINLMKQLKPTLMAR